MARNESVYTMKLNAEPLLNAYKQAIEQMKSAGASSKVTEGLEANFKKLSSRLTELQTQAKNGFINSKSMESFQRSVETAIRQCTTFETSLKGVSGKIQNLQDKSVKAGKKIETAFTNLGFADAAKAAEEVAKAEDKQAAVSKVLTEELKKRIQAVQSLKQAYNDAQNAINADVVSQTGTGKQKAFGNKAFNGAFTDSSGAKFNSIFSKKSGDADAVSQITTRITDLVNKGQAAADIIQRIRQEINNNNEWASAVKTTEGLESRITALVNYRQGLREASTEIQKFEQAQRAQHQIGSLAGGQFTQNAKGTRELTEAVRERVRAEQALSQVTTADVRSEDQVNNAIKGTAQAATVASGELDTLTASFRRDSAEAVNAAKKAEQTSASFERMKNSILMLMSATSIFSSIRRIISQTLNDVKTLDKAFGSIAMVTNETINSMWSSYNQYNQMAKNLGQTTEGVIKASALFRQQGLDTAEALSLTEDTMKLATLAGADFATATEEMTSAIRGFKMEMTEGAHVTDVYSELAAHAAASVDDIAQAMARTASIANSAGMSFENTSAFLTQMIETTQESAENIGTSMKTIIARFTELKTNVAGTSESEFADLDFNKVDTALKSVGVALKDTQGQFRDLDQVFLELSQKWDTLDRNTQRYVATIAAGSRQQSRFIAMMDNYERTAELMELAADAEGKADEQFAKYADTMEYKLNQLKNVWEAFRVSLMDSDMFKGIIDGLTEALQKVKSLDFKKVLVLAPFAISAAKNFVLTFITQIKTMSSSFAQVGNIIKDGIGKVFKKVPGLKLFYKAEMDAKSEEETLNNLRRNLAGLQEEANRQKLNLTLSLNETEIQGLQTKLNQVWAQVDAGAIDAAQGIDQLKQTLQNAGFNAETSNAILAELGITEQTLGADSVAAADASLTLANNINATREAAAKSEAKLKKYDTVAKATATSASQLASGLTMMFSAMIAGTSATDAGRMGLMMFGSQLLSMAVTIVPQVIAAWRASALAAKVSSAETIAAAEATQAALISTGIGAIVVALGAAIAGLVMLAGSMKESGEAAKVNNSATGKLAEQNELLKKSISDVTEECNKEKEALQTTQEQLNSLEDVYKKFISKDYLTPDELEEYKSASEDLANTLPDVVDFYDREGNAVLKDKQAIEELIKEKKKLKNESEKKVAGYDLETSLAEYQIANNDVTKYNIEKELEAENLYIQALKYVKDANAAGRDYATDSLTTDASKGNLNPHDASIWEVNGEKYITTPDGTKIYTKDAYGAMTGVGLLKGILDSDNANDIGTYIRDALVAKGKNGVFNVDENANGIDTINNIMDELADGKEQDEQAALDDLQDALKEYPDELERLFGDAVRDAAEKKGELDKAISATIKASAGSNTSYTEASKNVQMIVDNYIGQQHGLSVNEIEDNFKATEEGKQYFDDQGVLKKDLAKEYNTAFSKYLSEQVQSIIDPEVLDKELTDVIDEYGEYIDAFYEKVLIEGTSPVDQLQQLKKDEAAGLVDSKVVDAMLSQYQTEIDRQIASNNQLASAIGGTATSDKFGFLTGLGEGNQNIVNFYNELGYNARMAFAKGIGQYANEHSDAETKALAGKWVEAFKDLPAEAATYLNEIDWSTFSSLNSGTFKDKVVKGLVEGYDISEEKAEEYYNKILEFAEKTGQANLEYVNTAQLEAWNESVEKIAEAIQKNDDIIKKYAVDNREAIRVSAEDYAKLSKAQEALMAAGIPKEQLDNVLKFDEATKSWVLNGKQWNEVIKTSGVYTAEMAQKQLEINKQKLNDVNLTQQQRIEIETANERLEQMIESQKTLNQYTAATAGYWESIADKIDNFANLSSTFGTVGKKQKDDGFLGVKEISSLADAFRAVGDTEFDITRFVNDQMQLNIDTLYEYINAKITEIEVSGQLNEATAEELLMWKAMKKELIATRNEVNAASDALEDKAKTALENYEKQQETVTEKQKALNDKLKEYNDLIYGSDNRKSGLDLLYNYEQALSSLNDEMERSKELLEDSKTREEAYENLKNYTQATHAYLVEEKAKQRVIEQGLANYARMIESGSASYTNKETGEQINVNFGAYAKKDSRTGKYIIDQRLLQESKFTDEYKELIEQQISTYNEYVDKYKESQDKVRKIEKELQQQRIEAVKNYASMEKTIADALKAQYEEQVNDLKDKYEAMKDADDDYLDALQDAIDKQRKLRDEENAWEDLATKEKKLSLMQRDTSGANALETANLEKEIEDDRQNLLDQAIDNIIDGLSKLYESQQELRDSELELKDALLENTLYWNSQAQDLAAQFTSAEEYAAFLSSISKEYAEMTLAMQEEKLNEYGEQFSAASQYLAMQAMDEASATGDFVVDTVTVSGAEISDVVAETSEAFTTEVTRAYNETTEAFIKDLEKAEEEIAKAKADLADAIAKLDELAGKANEAAAALANANASVGVNLGGGGGDSGGGSDSSTSERNWYSFMNQKIGVDHNALDDISKKFEGEEQTKAYIRAGTGRAIRGLTQEEIDDIQSFGFFVGRVGKDFKIFSDRAKRDFWVDTNAPSMKGDVHKYLNGGLVDYTGPAWVDGSTDRPEAFLSAEDTERIGNAAKILSDIPWMDRETDNTSVVTNNGGDVNVEINLNIDHISSDTDIDEMIQRVKDEIVDVARPEGTNVILQQQLN